jgi:transposase-like protein
MAGSRSKRYTPEQIVVKLRQAEKLQNEGKTIAQVVKVLGITDQTLFRWRRKFGAMDEAEATRLKLLEAENAQLKRIVADQALDIRMLKDLNEKKW